MTEIRSVLCPTDFSPVADRGVDLATQICDCFGSRLVIQYNLDTLPPLYLASLELIPDSQLRLEEDQEARADQLLENLISSFPTTFRAERRITKGIAHHSILELAEELDVDLIVMGTHGRSGLGHVLVGSTTERVIVQSHRPVLTAREKGHNLLIPDREMKDSASKQQMLVPIDFSPHSLDTLDYARGLMERLPFKLNLLHVVEPISWDDMRGATHFNVPEFQHHRLKEAEQQLAQLVPEALAERTQVLVRMGPVIHEIVGVAAALEARMVVMGTRARTLLDELLFGPTAYGVLCRSSCPVWVVPGKRAVMEVESAEKAGAVPG